MAISNEDNSMVMPVTPMYGGNGGGFGGFGGDLSWLVIFILFAVFGGWGNGNGFGGGGSGMNGSFPWLLAANNNTGDLVTSGFNNAAITSQLSGIQSSLTNGFASAEVNACNRASDALIASYGNQIASMNQNFANQTAMNQGFNALQGQLANCCCANELATTRLGADIARENCADRAAVSDGIRDVIANQTANTQATLDAIRSINDKLCDQELQAERRENENLRTQLNMQNLAASQAAQTAQLIADNTAQTQYVVNRVAPYPVPAYLVNNGCGCGNYNYGCGCGM